MDGLFWKEAENTNTNANTERRVMADISLDMRIIGFLHSLSAQCKNCHGRGIECRNCKIDGVDSLVKDIESNTQVIIPIKTEARRRKDQILAILAERPLTSHDIVLCCNRFVKSQTLRELERTGEIITIQSDIKKPKLYGLPSARPVYNNNKNEG